MGAFGERLQREREMRGITLDEIAEATKIGTRSLQALEAEEFGKLPGGIFNKGFVRAYARYLGINEEQAVADYLAAIKEREEPQAEPKPVLIPAEEAAPDALSAPAPWRAFAAILLIAAVAAAGWYYYRRRPAQQETEPAGVEQALPPAVKAALPVPATTPATAVPSRSAPVTPELTPKPLAPAAEKSAVFEVHIKAVQESWMQVTADGKTVLDRIMKPAEETSIRAENEIVLITGNAGGVELSHNGKALAALGPENVRRKAVFTPAGLQQ